MKKIRYLIGLIILGIFCINLLDVSAFNNVLLHIEFPSDKKVDNTLSVSGWVMSNNFNTVKVYFDNDELDNVDRIARKDVLDAVKDHGDSTTNPLPGFNKNIDISNYKDGAHNVIVRVFGKESQMLAEESRTVIVEKYKSLINIEEPSVNVFGEKLVLGGWIMSSSPSNKLRVFLDNVEVTDIERVERLDVLKAIKGYGDGLNKTPGFKKELDATNILDGFHNLKVELIDLNTNEVLCEKSVKFTLKKYKNKMYLEEPQTIDTFGTNIKVSGWVMTEASDVSVKTYIDGNFISVADRRERLDVIRAVKGYGDIKTNEKPGFINNIDLSLLDDGRHNLEVEVVNNVTNEVLAREKRVINLQKYKTLINIEEPSVSKIEGDTLIVSGWVMSGNSHAVVQVLVNDKKIDLVTRSKRADVLRAIKGYEDNDANKTPGFKSLIDTSSMMDGAYKITVRVVDSRDESLICEKEKNIVLNKYKAKLNIEEGLNSEVVGDKISLSGWLMSNDRNADIKIIFDDEEIGDINRVERLDVIKAVKGYGDSSINKTPGFSKVIDLSTIGDGTHNVKVLVFDNVTKEELCKFSKKIILKKYKTTGVLEEPKMGEKVGYSFNISFWIMSTIKNKNIKLFVDNEEISDVVVNSFERKDVIRAVKDYGDSSINKTPGYNINFDMSSYNDGKHSIEVRVVNFKTNEILLSLKREIILKKYEGIINIDSPNLNYFKSSIDVEGWKMSNNYDSYVKIYIDNVDTLASLEEIERLDVLKAFKNQYGGEVINPTPGFKGKIDLTSIKAGNHMLTFKLFSKDGEVLDSYENNICVRECLIEYYTQLDTRWANMVYGLSTMSKSGCAPTAISMAFSTILGKKILPTDIANYLYYNTFEFNKKSKGTSGLGIIYASNYFKVKYTPITSREKLISELADGKIVFAAMGNGRFATPFYNHAIILYSYNNGNTYAYDPLRKTNNGNVSIEQILNEQSRDPDDSLGGSNFYSLVGYY